MSDTTKMTFGVKLMLVFTILCLATGAYKCTKTFVGDDVIQISHEKISSELFCGKEFTCEDYQSEIDLKKKYLTVLNCDGTYVSELNWNAHAPSSEKIYNNTFGTTRGNFKSFSGSWEIVTNNIPDYLNRQINEYENFESNHMPKGQTTVIKYHSKEGRSGYAYIYKSSDNGEVILTPVPSALEVSTSYEDDDLQMYFGRF